MRGMSERLQFTFTPVGTPDFKGPLWMPEDGTGPTVQIPGYLDADGKTMFLPQGTIHCAQKSGAIPRQINYERSVLLAPGQRFTYPFGAEQFFRCVICHPSGEEIVSTWIPAIQKEEEIVNGQQVLRFSARNTMYQAAFPDDLPPLVRVRDEINPLIGEGSSEFFLATNGQDFGVPPTFTLIGSAPEKVLRVTAPPPRPIVNTTLNTPRTPL